MSLLPWDRNPRRNDIAAQKVAESIKRFGFGSPILARREDGEVIAGHTRLKAAEMLGIDKVPVRYLDLDPADAHLLALADNKLGEVADWNAPQLADVLSDFSLEAVELAGWDSKALEDLADEVADFGPLESDGSGEEFEEGEVPEPPKDPVTRPGDVWALGDHRLVCGDCRDDGTLAELLDGTPANVVFTSPPYASQRKYDESSGFKPIPPDEYGEWWEAVQRNVRGVLADDGSFFVNIKEHCEDGQRHLYVKRLTIAMVERWCWRFVDELCWLRKAYPGDMKGRFKNGWEPVLHFSEARPKHRPDAVLQPSKAYASAKSGTRPTSVFSDFEWSAGDFARPSNVLDVPTGEVGGAVSHTATFPVGLPSFFIRAYSDPGDAILDPFMGSGTTIVAAEKEGRRGFGSEISPAYCDVIAERWQNLTGGTATRE